MLGFLGKYFQLNWTVIASFVIAIAGFTAFNRLYPFHCYLAGKECIIMAAINIYQFWSPPCTHYNSLKRASYRQNICYPISLPLLLVCNWLKV